jgi:hydrogenase maturation protease
MLGDNGVGWKVADEIRRQLPDESIKVVCLSLGGISLMEHLIGYQRAILIDALHLDEPLGTIRVFKLDSLPDYSGYQVSGPYDTSLRQALELGRSIGAPVPEDVIILGIITNRILDFSSELSRPAANAVPQAVRVVYDLLKGPAASYMKRLCVSDYALISLQAGKRKLIFLRPHYRLRRGRNN